jgi:hypothetical protein
MMDHLHFVIGTLVGMDTASVLNSSLRCFAEVIEVTRGARWLEVLSAASFRPSFGASHEPFQLKSHAGGFHLTAAGANWVSGYMSHWFH